MEQTGRKVLSGLVTLSTLIWAAALQAAPQDEHQRGLLALQRGDVATAMTVLRAPAAAGHAPSQSLLAFMLDRADMSAEAARLWRSAAAQGDAEAHVGLANLNLGGRGVAKDEKQALRHFSEAAALWHAAAIEQLATAWLTGQWGTNAEADPAAAAAAVQRAAQQGHLPSAEALVLAHRSGRFGLVVDEAQASAWQARVSAWRQQRAVAAVKGQP